MERRLEQMWRGKQQDLAVRRARSGREMDLFLSTHHSNRQLCASMKVKLVFIFKMQVRLCSKRGIVAGVLIPF